MGNNLPGNHEINIKSNDVIKSGPLVDSKSWKIFLKNVLLCCFI
jgi:hypothetical protein